MLDQAVRDSLASQAGTAQEAADELDLVALVKEAQLEAGVDGSGWTQLADGVGEGLPDLSSSEIDPDDVYRFLVEMLGEEGAQKAMLDVISDAMEAGIDEQENGGPSRQDLRELLDSIRMQRDSDDSEDWAAGEWGAQ